MAHTNVGAGAGADAGGAGGAGGASEAVGTSMAILPVSAGSDGGGGESGAENDAVRSSSGDVDTVGFDVKVVVHGWGGVCKCTGGSSVKSEAMGK